MISTNYIGSIDQGTSSTRFIIFDEFGKIIVSHQMEFRQFYPKQGWCEHDPIEIINTIRTCIQEAIIKFIQKGLSTSDIKAIGITNQRETTVVWDKTTGTPVHNAIVWLDARTKSTVAELVENTPTKDKQYFQSKCGLPISTYFSGVKLKWLLDNSEEVKYVYNKGDLLFGTIDSWILYNLTGGTDGGVHLTDVTNASRTMLMNLKTLNWDEELLEFFNVNSSILPNICSSSEVYGHMFDGPLKGIPISGILGDQQAAVVGQRCFKPGEGKNTYGTGCFMLFNTGDSPVISKNGLLTTVAYQLGKEVAPVYALEGSVAIAGAAIKWLRDNLNIIKEANDINILASNVENNGGVYFVPAFSGLFAPYWRDDARGTIVGLTQYATKNHIARATLEAICFQSKEVLDAMNSDSGHKLVSLKVDGGMTNSDLGMQIQSDLLGINVERPSMRETTALGAALAAGLAVKLWETLDDFQPGHKSDVFSSTIGNEEREKSFSKWKRAVQKSLDWEI